MKAKQHNPHGRSVMITSLGTILLVLTPVTSQADQTNTATGVKAGASFNNVGLNNTANGFSALRSNTSGSGNTALGAESLLKNVTGTRNTAIGAFSLSSNTAGESNVALGNEALGKNTRGKLNTALGDGALFNCLGNQNIGIGEDGGFNLTRGNNNIAIGNVGVATDNGIIRIGTNGTHTDTFLDGGIVHLTRGIRMGSGTGTSENPETQIIHRRTTSKSTSAGQIIAIGSSAQLVRDGTNAGISLKTTEQKRTTVTAMGINTAGNNVNKVILIPQATAVGTTFPIFANADNVIFATIRFGNPYNVSGLTEVTLQREPGDYYWDGFITSNTNQ